MKYLYVLVSDDTDYYLEQALMSVTSLKMRMPDGFVSLLIDASTERTLIGKRRNILSLVNEVKVVEIDGNKFNKKSRSRWLKTSMRQHVDGDFLYIDCDTVICSDISEIFQYKMDMGAVMDEHMRLNTWLIKKPTSLKNLQEKDRKLGFVSSIQSNTHYNSGVIFARDTPIVHEFYAEWHQLWLHCVSSGIVTDQQSLNQANFHREGMIEEIDPYWNCQISCDGAICFLENAKIIHYFYETLRTRRTHYPYLLPEKDIFQQIKINGNVSAPIMKLLEHPRRAFNKGTRLVVSDDFDNSLSYIVFRELFHKKVLSFFEFILSIILRIKKKKHKT